jgi:hypothetical protein
MLLLVLLMLLLLLEWSGVLRQSWWLYIGVNSPRSAQDTFGVFG